MGCRQQWATRGIGVWGPFCCRAANCCGWNLNGTCDGGGIRNAGIVKQAAGEYCAYFNMVIANYNIEGSALKVVCKDRVTRSVVLGLSKIGSVSQWTDSCTLGRGAKCAAVVRTYGPAPYVCYSTACSMCSTCQQFSTDIVKKAAFDYCDSLSMAVDSYSPSGYMDKNEGPWGASRLKVVCRCRLANEW